MASDAGFLTRMYLRDCAFLMNLYRRSDSRRVWAYAVFGFGATLSAFILFLFFVIATLFSASVPVNLHPATASEQILLVEGVAIFVTVGFSVERYFRDLKEDVCVLAARYCTFGDRLKWGFTTLLGIASLAGAAYLTVAMHG